MKIAITGSSGFVGTALKQKLIKANHKIIEIDFDLGFDLTNWESVKKIECFDVLIHLAAKSFVPDSFENPSSFYKTNILTTLNALELCRKYKAKMIYTSSYVYGSPKYLPIDEDHPIVAFNPYAQSKIIGEDLCKGYFRDFDVPVIIFRPFNIYGRSQDHNFLISKIIKQAYKGRIELEDSRPKRDFIFIEDVVDAYEKAISYNTSKFEIFNIGSGQSTTIRMISEINVKKKNNKIPIFFSEKRRKNEVLETLASIEKAKNLLKWHPKNDIKMGISKIIETKVI